MEEEYQFSTVQTGWVEDTQRRGEETSDVSITEKDQSQRRKRGSPIPPPPHTHTHTL